MATKDLTSIHNEDTLLAIALKAMTQRADVVPIAQRDQFVADLGVFAKAVSALHLAGDLGQQAKAENELRHVKGTFKKLESYFPEWTLTAALKSITTFMCPMHRDVIGNRTSFCAKCGMELDQLIRVLPSDSELQASTQVVRASIKTPAPLNPGETSPAILRLQKANGEPVFSSDLIETHTKRIHLLIIDQSLTDYHHEHPMPTKNPGEYSFSFTPRKSGTYRAWADLRPQPLGMQEYCMTDIPGAMTADAPIERTTTSKAAVDGLNYELLLMGDQIRVGVPIDAKLRITTLDGKPFTQLEPVMATFAHIVGFNEDRKTVLHMHPKGVAISDPKARGGPELEFRIYALKAGFYRLFAQVQIDGHSRFAPFGIQVVR